MWKNRNDFVEGARQLVLALEEVERERAGAPTSLATKQLEEDVSCSSRRQLLSLLDWSLVNGGETKDIDDRPVKQDESTRENGGNLVSSTSNKDDGYHGCADVTAAPYLLHPTVQQRCHRSVLSENREEAAGSEEALTEDRLHDKDWSDDSVLIDSDCVCYSDKDREDFITTSWRFSIVFHETWRVPVLYFDVCHAKDGSPCLRQTVLDLLLHQCQQQSHQIQDSWDFVSQEEHPVTGHAVFFLHPCRTAERLSSLLDRHSIASEREKDDDQEELSPALALLSWMSMNLPSVGYAIPSTTFLAVQEKLRKR